MQSVFYVTFRSSKLSFCLKPSYRTILIKELFLLKVLEQSALIGLRPKMQLNYHSMFLPISSIFSIVLSAFH